jgi:hypothetical protein
MPQQRQQQGEREQRSTSCQNRTGVRSSNVGGRRATSGMSAGPVSIPWRLRSPPTMKFLGVQK